MTRCPYCKALCNPLRFAFSTKLTPYKCPKCNQKSVIKRRDIVLFYRIGGIGGGLIAIFGRNIILARLYNFLLFVLLLSLLLTFIFWFFMKVYPIETQKQKAEQKE